MRLIDADALKNKIEQHSYPLSDRINSIENGMFLCGIYQAVDESPTVDVVPVVRGEWSNEIGDVHSAGKYRVCSACGKNAFILWSSTLGLHGVDYNYCPNCGADMRESEVKE